jgi:hypothetical protein
MTNDCFVVDQKEKFEIERMLLVAYHNSGIMESWHVLNRPKPDKCLIASTEVKALKNEVMLKIMRGDVFNLEYDTMRREPFTYWKLTNYGWKLCYMLIDKIEGERFN